MQIRAENDPRYSRKFLIMGICAIGFALWCLYDGLINYPAKRERHFVEYRSFFKDEQRRTMTVGEFEAVANHDERLKWDEYSHTNGIPSGPDIVTQYIMATVMSLAGLYLVSLPLRARGRWIEGTDTGIGSSWGENVRYDEIEEVNKRKWRSKGIAKLTYVSGGKRRSFVIDDYKFERYPTDAILYELEQRIDLGRITNGPPEPAPEGRVAEILGVTPASEQVAPV